MKTQSLPRPDVREQKIRNEELSTDNGRIIVEFIIEVNIQVSFSPLAAQPVMSASDQSLSFTTIITIGCMDDWTACFVDLRQEGTPTVVCRGDEEEGAAEFRMKQPDALDDLDKMALGSCAHKGFKNDGDIIHEIVLKSITRDSEWHL
jgi:hypothetical protein